MDSAVYVVEQFEALILSLDENLQRGDYPQQMINQGIKFYREVSFKPYRVIYEIIERKVIIHLVADGRRDVVSLLERRLMR